jgi:hypothetical protein
MDWEKKRKERAARQSQASALRHDASRASNERTAREKKIRYPNSKSQEHESLSFPHTIHDVTAEVSDYRYKAKCCAVQGSMH